MDSRTIGLLLNTAFLAVGTVAVGLPIGGWLAVLIVKTDLPGRRFAAAVLAAMLFVPLFALAAGWEAGFGLSGWFTRLIHSSSSSGPRSPLFSGWIAVLWIHGLAAVPWAALLVGIGLRAVERELEEDALLDTSTPHVFLRVTLRRAAPSLGVAALWIAIAAASEIAITDLFQIRTFAEEVYVRSTFGPLLDSANRITGEHAAGVGVFWAGFGLCGVLFVAAYFVCRRLTADVLFAPFGMSQRWALGRFRWAAAASAYFALALLAVLPIANLVAKAGTSVSQTGGEFRRSWSPAKAVARIAEAPARRRRELTGSLAAGISASATATGAATLLAWWCRRRRLRLTIAIGLISMLMMIPGPILGVGTIWLLNRPPDSLFHWFAWFYDLPWFAPWFVQLVRALPIAFLILWPAVSNVSTTVLDAARADGAGQFRRLTKIAIPQIRGAVALSLLVGLAVAVGELSATNLVYPPGTSPISVQVFNMLHSGVDDRLAALVLVLFGGSMAATLAPWIAFQHWARLDTIMRN